MAKGSNGTGGKTKPQRVAEEVARSVGAGRAVQLETVDFSDPKRPKTCLEVDFPILPVNQVATIEGNASKPIYQMSKWWARRRSSVFRSLLLSAAMKAPDDASQAAKAVWDVYYANHQKKKAFAKLKVADIFMGGGTTVVEGSRLGMQMFGNDLNPVAWFVVKSELAQVKKEELEALLADIEADVKPQIMPYYACRGPRGERGTWTQLSTGKVMGSEFDALSLKADERKDYRYEGPEVIYVFWSKHGPCQVTGCGHRTPIMTSPVIAVKQLTVKSWPHECKSCGVAYDIEDSEARMAPDAALVLAPDQKPFAVLHKSKGVVCPSCAVSEAFPVLAKAEKKKVELTLLAHPDWLSGEGPNDASGAALGGSFTDDADSTARWNQARSRRARFIEVRGSLPEEVTDPASGTTLKTSQGTVPKKSNFACGACGKVQDILSSVKFHGKSGPVAAYGLQCYSPTLDREGAAYNGRFFAAADEDEARRSNAALREWQQRSEGDLREYWPRSEVPYGFMTHHNNGGIANHGFTHWWTMFNPRQLLVNALLLKSICTSGGSRHAWPVREYVLAAFQQYLRNQNLFCIWDIGYDKLVPHMSNNNYHPKATMVENGVFADLGRGNWQSCSSSLAETLEWAANPWEIVSGPYISALSPTVQELAGDKNQKAYPSDVLAPDGVVLNCGSATDLSTVASASHDLVITDPPFGGLLHYSELADFFYVWLRLALRERYPEQFEAEHTPKTLEAVSNRARHPDDADAYYERLLTASWKEAHRILKPGGILAFTFHHSEDAPWVSVLESLFEAGFYLEATWPIRSDETKGEGSKPGTFGSQKIEYDIVHVCRKRMEDPTPVSWAKMRRQVLQDVQGLKHMLEHHQKAGLPDADLQVIRRGKALEYYSRHYGKVLIDDGRTMSVLEALVGINQLLDEQSGGVKDPPPVSAEPFTRQFLRLFDGVNELPRDQMSKFLRGTGLAPSDFETRGWCSEERKIYRVTAPLEVARAWQGKHRRGMTSDYDQAAFLIGACFENSGINATDTLANDNFKPHPALGSLLEWFATRGSTSETRNAASRAQTILRSWRAKNEKQVQQISLFFDEPGAE
jgi:putative DNA methylase